MRAECFGQSRPQEGRLQTLNQDAFVIGRQPVPWMALCDVAGNAQSVARRALGLLDMRLEETPLGHLLRDVPLPQQLTGTASQNAGSRYRYGAASATIVHRRWALPRRRRTE